MIMPASYVRGWKIVRPVFFGSILILGVKDIFYAGSQYSSPFLSLFQIIQTELSIPSLCQLVVSCSESKAFAQSCWCTFHFCIVINTDFFGLQLEASFLNLVYFHGMYLLVNRQYKNYRIYIGAALWNHFHFPRLFYLGFTLFYSLIFCKTLPKLSKGVRKSCQVLSK